MTLVFLAVARSVLWTRLIFTRTAQVALLTAGALCLTGCSPDPLEGEWRTKRLVCDRRGEMVLDSEWTGTAEIPIDCDVTCKMDCDAYEAGEDRYELRVKIKTDSVCHVEDGGTMAKYDCTLEDEGSTLDCGNFNVWHWQG
jgi:hypothetical protein